MVKRIEGLWTALTAAALSSWVLPAVALAQTAPRGSGAAPQGSDPVSRASGSSNWLWIVAALVIIALVWWAMAGRRRSSALR